VTVHKACCGGTQGDGIIICFAGKVTRPLGGNSSAVLKF
jgi:hypothetical protein